MSNHTPQDHLNSNESLNHLLSELQRELSHLFFFESNKSLLLTDILYSQTSLMEVALNDLEAYLDNFELYSNKYHALTNSLPSHFSGEKYLVEIQQESILSFQELNNLCLCLEFVSETKLPQKLYSDINISSFKNFISEFRQVCSPELVLNFRHHAVLAPLIKELDSLDGEIRDEINSSPFKSKYSYSSYDILNDSFVLAIPSDTYSHALGKIVSHSRTGSTIFIEPKSLRNKNLRRVEISSKIESEKFRLQKKYCIQLQKNFLELEKVLAYIFYLDLLNAKAELSNAHSLTKPEISSQPIIQLSNAFHPSVDSPIGNSITLNSQRPYHVISGANAGGKSTLLKTVISNIILCKMGCFVPAESAKVFPFEKIYFYSDLGDSMSHGLSSFTKELTSHFQLLDSKATGPVLICIDEVFKNTNSLEATALAVAFFDYIQTHWPQAYILVSTHHDALKDILHKSNQWMSYHVGFDEKNQTPTYKLHEGSPDQSHAITIAEKYCSSVASKEIINKAHIVSSTLSGKNKDQAVTALDHKQEIQALERSIHEKEEQLVRLEEKIRIELKNEKQRELNRFRRELEAKISAFEEKLDKTSSLSPDKIKGQAASLFNQYTFQDTDRDTPPSLQKLHSAHVGQVVYSSTIKKNATVEKISSNKKKVYLKLGTLGVWDHFENIYEKINQNSPKEFTGQTHVRLSDDIKMCYDLRGQRLEEFQREVEYLLDRFLASSQPFLEIIHGHGDLRRWLRSYLVENKDYFTLEENAQNQGVSKILKS